MLVLPLAVYRTPTGRHIERQACNGLRLWLENFDQVEFFGPEFVVNQPPPASLPVEQIVHAERLSIYPLPGTYNPITFARRLPAAARVLRRHIRTADYLHFGIAGVWGDWGSVAAQIAQHEKRPYAVWTDQVASRVADFTARGKRGINRLYWNITAALTGPYERNVIRGAALGLFHGADCYAAFAPISPAPRLVHDIHVPRAAAITPAELDRKLAELRPELQIVYAGRAHPQKGIRDWIETLTRLAEQGVNYHATWFGEGHMLDDARAAVATAGLESRIQFPGNVEEHAVLLRHLKKADLFLFCHKIPESPRCLVEALICGTPIVGYRWPFAEELISENRGGILTPTDDTASLAGQLAELTIERRADLIRRAAQDGSHFNDEAVFRHRSELMKELLSKP